MGLLDLFKKPEPTSPAPVQETKGKILVVDDEQMLKDFYEDLLTRQGYQVFTAANGQEGLTVAVQQQPDVILLDLMMPVMDGFQALEQLKQNDQTMHIPVIVLSNAGSVDNMDKAKGYTVFKFFVKSNVEPEELLETVSDAVRVARHPEEKQTIEPS